MTKKVTALVFGIILMSTYSVNAMNCHDTSDEGHNASMTDHMSEVMGEGAIHGNNHEGHDTGYDHHMDSDQMVNPIMNDKTARYAVKKHMSGKGITDYHIESIENNDNHYVANVHSHSGDLLDKLYIDKKTGSIHSLLEE